MRKLLGYAMAFMLAVGFASCSSDDKMPGDDGAGDAGAVSFTIEMPKGAYKPATYSDGGIANSNEWNIASIDIYAFESNGTYIKKMVDGTDYRMAETGENKWRIIVDQDFVLDYEFKSVHFYFVGNDATSMRGAHIADDWDGTEADFKNLITNQLEVTNDKAEQIAINGNDENLLFSGVARNVYMGGKVSKAVTLKRREARFDILNDNVNVELHRVWIYDAALQGFIFADATADEDMETADLVSIDLSTIELNDETNMWESVFYLYPTELSLEKTQIVIAATIEGEDKIFNLGSKVMVEANKRYKLILDKSTLTFNIEVVDYDEGEELPIGQDEGEITFDLTHAQFDGKVLNMAHVNATGNITVTVNSIHGTRPEIIYHLGSPAELTDPDYEIANPSKVVTYSYGTEDTYTITVPKKVSDAGNFVNMEVRFVSVVDDTKSASFYFRSLNRGVMPAQKGFLAYEEGGAGLNMDGKGKQLYFRLGSLVGLHSRTYSFSKDNVIYAPEGYDMDGLKNFIGTTTGQEAYDIVPHVTDYTEISAENNLRAGLGDPCKELQDKDGQKGAFRMPRDKNELNITNAVWDDKKVGWHSNNGEIFRAMSGGLTRVGNMSETQGERGYSRVTGTNSIPYATPKQSDGLVSGSNNPYYALPVRCIRAE